MKLLHTADVHLDHCFADSRVPAAIANWRRQHLRELFMELLRRAAADNAAALLIAGDLFETRRMTRDTVAFLREAFDLARPVPVVIAPGHADSYGPASPYATEIWPENVHIFREPLWVPIHLPEASLVIHGAACVAGGPAEPPFDKLRVPQDDATHVAVCHAGWQSGGACAPAGNEASSPALVSGLAYLALGHDHAASEIHRKGGAAAWYSGALENLAYGQTGIPGYLEVEIDRAKPALSVSVRHEATEATHYLEKRVDCSELSNEAQIIDSIAGIGRSQQRDTIARIILTGRRPADARFSLERIGADAGKNFVHLELVDRCEPPGAAQNSAVLPGSQGLFLERMRNDISGTTDPARRDMLRRAEALGGQAYHGGLPGGGES